MTKEQNPDAVDAGATIHTKGQKCPNEVTHHSTKWQRCQELVEKELRENDYDPKEYDEHGETRRRHV